jgi:ABC-2 type transport system ATP-binding protein
MVAVEVSDLTHRYGARAALSALSFTVGRGELFAVLGPNGGGKTTLFRIAATLLRPTSGTVRVFGDDVRRASDRVRRRLGVVFQSPALDPRLTARENLIHHGRLYGLRGTDLSRRVADALARLAVADRGDDEVRTLSGGLQRRVELAKCLLQAPDLLLLDEPTTGLDPGARRELWDHLLRLREQDGTTVVMTTHLMDEAGRADRVGIVHQGKLVAMGRPEELTAAIGGDVILITAHDADRLSAQIRDRFGLAVERTDGRLRIERPEAHRFITDLVETFPGEIEAVTFGRPTLEDVFVHHTGARVDS